MSGECILIIDDSREIVKHLTEHVLVAHGYKVQHAYNGQSGLDLIQTLNPDLVMLDYNLPEMTGVDVLRVLAREGNNVPVILMSGYGSELSAIEAFRLGAKDYLIKPFTSEEVLETIDNALLAQRLLHDKTKLADQLRHTKAALNRQSQEMETLLKIGTMVMSLAPVDRVLQQTLDAAIELTTAQGSIIWLPEHTGSNFLGFQKLIHENPSVNGSVICEPMMNRQAAQIMAAKRPLRTSDFSQPGIRIAPQLFAQALLHVPLNVGEISTGVLTVFNIDTMSSFSKRDEYQLTVLANFAAIALDNARRFEDISVSTTEKANNKK